MSEKLRIREAILVEGRYDVNTVRQLVDTVVLETGGFRIFNDYDRLQLIRRIASARGLIILTDSDGAGFVIRNYLKGALQKEQVKQAYIPDISGKERIRWESGPTVIFMYQTGGCMTSIWIQEIIGKFRLYLIKRS